MASSGPRQAHRGTLLRSHSPTTTAPSVVTRSVAPSAVALAAVGSLLLAGCAAAADRTEPDPGPSPTPPAATTACPADGGPVSVRVSGTDRIATAIALTEAGWAPGEATKIVVASARDFPDALAATPWAAAHGAPLLLTEPDGLPAAVGDTIERLGPDEVVIVGGASAVSDAVRGDLEARGVTVRRLAGSDRFATADAVATDLHTAARHAVLVTSHAFADAVAAGPLVVRGEHPPILLTRPDSLPPATRATLGTLGVERVTVVGGQAVVGQAVLDQLEDERIAVERVSGSDRYATSAAVVTEAATTQGGREAVAVVTGAAFPDALAANAFAARRDATVLLVDPDDVVDHPATGQVLAAAGPSWRCTTVVGGAGAVGVRVAEQVAAATGADPPDGPATVLAAGDIASCGLRSDDATAELLDGLAGTVLTLGDNVYNDGTAREYADCYAPSWGRHLVRTRASLGNHDIRTLDGAPTYDYFGVRAGPRGQGWYAFDLGPHWRVLVVNTNCPGTVRCDAGSDQATWLRDQLAAAGDRHVIVAGHHPRWSSGAYAPGEQRVAHLWEVAAANGADLWLAGHEHGYERFEPKDADGAADPAGIQQITAGTGGASLRPFGPPQPGSQAVVSAHGVLALTLHADGYEWRLVDTAGATRDEGARSL